MSDEAAGTVDGVGDDPARLTSAADGPFLHFYQGQYQRAVRLAWLLLRDAAAAEDATQDAFVGLWRRFEQVDNPAAFLRRAVVNNALARIRNRSRESAKLRLVQAQPTSAASEEPELLDLIGALPDRQRAVVVLRYWLGSSEQEIAAALGCRPGTVKSLASRALTRLREEMHDET